MKETLIKNKYYLILGFATAFFGMLTLFLFASSETSSPTLIENWKLEGSKTVSEFSKSISSRVLSGKNILRVTYNLNGLCALKGKASSLVFTDKQTQKKYLVSLSDYGTNCSNQIQTVDIPLSHFEIPKNSHVDTITASFWYPTHFAVDIKSASVIKSDDAVLGETTKKDNVKKTFPNITPIREFPYAKSSQ